MDKNLLWFGIFLSNCNPMLPSIKKFKTRVKQHNIIMACVTPHVEWTWIWNNKQIWIYPHYSTLSLRNVFSSIWQYYSKTANYFTTRKNRQTQSLLFVSVNQYKCKISYHLLQKGVARIINEENLTTSQLNFAPKLVE